MGLRFFAWRSQRWYPAAQARISDSLKKTSRPNRTGAGHRPSALCRWRVRMETPPKAAACSILIKSEMSKGASCAIAQRKRPARSCLRPTFSPAVLLSTHQGETRRRGSVMFRDFCCLAGACVHRCQYRPISNWSIDFDAQAGKQTF